MDGNRISLLTNSDITRKICGNDVSFCNKNFDNNLRMSISIVTIVFKLQLHRPL